MTMTTFKTTAAALLLTGQAAMLVLLFGGCEGSPAGRPDADSTLLTTRNDGAAPETDVASRRADAVGPETGVNLPESPALSLAAACTSDGQCETGHCADGVCCDGACDGDCSSCGLTGKVGTCSPVLEANDDTCEGESVCDAEGKCRHDLGRSCVGGGDCASGNCVDGVCCSSSACGTCQSCAVPGSAGACTPVAKFDDDDTCTGENTCNGLGGCYLKNGSSCDVGSACISQHCVDGVCCEQACSGTCLACNQPNIKGLCRPLNNVEDLGPAGTCGGDKVCTLRGAAPFCKLREGQPCKTSDDCAGGLCRTTYLDEDGDGYGSSTSVRRCEDTPAPGYVTRGGDCCDMDPLSSPVATTARTIRNRCGSYDWNCDGVEEPVSGGVR
jgi:hypothetical protein